MLADDTWADAASVAASVAAAKANKGIDRHIVSKAQASEAPTAGARVLARSTNTAFGLAALGATMFTLRLSRTRRRLLNLPFESLTKRKKRWRVAELEQDVSGLTVDSRVAIAAFPGARDDFYVAHSWQAKRRNRRLVPRAMTAALLLVRC